MCEGGGGGEGCIFRVLRANIRLPHMALSDFSLCGVLLTRGLELADFGYRETDQWHLVWVCITGSEDSGGNRTSSENLRLIQEQQFIPFRFS